MSPSKCGVPAVLKAALTACFLFPGVVHAQDGRFGFGPLVWVGAAWDDGSGPAGGVGLQIEYADFGLIGGVRWDSFASSYIGEDPAPIGPDGGPVHPTGSGDSGRMFSAFVLAPLRSGSVSFAAGPHFSIVDWKDDSGTSFGGGIEGRVDFIIGAGSLAIMPFIRMISASALIYQSGVGIVLLVRP